MVIEIRTPRADEMRGVANVVADALLSPRATDDEWVDREIGWLDFHSVVAMESDRCVGHAGSFDLQTTVPGGAAVRTSGVTRVGVLPTHTRRGLLSSMMRRLLTEARDRGAVLSSLRASEAVIYQRYGFEIAGEAASVTVDSRTARPLRSGAAGAVRILDHDEVRDVVPDLYDGVCRRRVGAVSRPALFWKNLLADASSSTKPVFVAVHSDAHGVLDGYVTYEVRWATESEGGDGGTGVIHDLFGADAGAELALWAFVLDIDLIRKWMAEQRPIDESVRFAVRDPRAYKLTQRWDEQWLRILDVDAALTARTFGGSDRSAVIEVTDPWFEGNNGRWRVSAAGVDQTDTEPDLVVSVGALSATYLGGTSWSEMDDAGLIEVRRSTAVADADLLFTQRPMPYCGTFF